MLGRLYRVLVLSGASSRIVEAGPIDIDDGAPGAVDTGSFQDFFLRAHCVLFRALGLFRLHSHPCYTE